MEAPEEIRKFQSRQGSCVITIPAAMARQVGARGGVHAAIRVVGGGLSVVPILNDGGPDDARAQEEPEAPDVGGMDGDGAGGGREPDLGGLLM